MEPEEKEEETVDRKNRAQRADQYGLNAWRFSPWADTCKLLLNNQADSREAIPAGMREMRHGYWPLQTEMAYQSPTTICLATVWLDVGSVRHTWSTLLGPFNFILINQFSELYYETHPRSEETAALWHTISGSTMGGERWRLQGLGEWFCFLCLCLKLANNITKLCDCDKVSVWTQLRAENLRLIIHCWVYLNFPQLQTARLKQGWSSCGCNLSSEVNVNGQLLISK